MSSRPRRSAAQRATVAITDMADRDNERPMSSSRTMRRSGGVASVSRGPPSSPVAGNTPATGSSESHIHLMVKNLPSSKLRQATTGGVSKADSSTAGKRSTRGVKKNYVIRSESEDNDNADDGDADVDDEIIGREIEVVHPAGLFENDDEMEDAEGDNVDDDVDMDAEDDDPDEDADADGHMDIDMQPTSVAKMGKSTATPCKNRKAHPAKAVNNTAAVSARFLHKNNDDEDADEDEDEGEDDGDDDEEEEDDDDELSELESEAEAHGTAKVTDVLACDEDAEGEDEDVDAAGKEIKVIQDGAEEEFVSDDDSLGKGTPNLLRMTARQRAKLGDASHEYMKLSDEVQVKKHFTAEELSMRRAEMARRRRNLSEKRNEEVKMETINKLLKKQAPKINRKTALLAGDETPDVDGPKANPIFVRWVNKKQGSVVAVPEDMLVGPAGQVFMKRGHCRGNRVEKVA